METMNFSLPEDLKDFILREVQEGSYSSVSEYIRALVRAAKQKKAKEALEAEILKGLQSGDSSPLTKSDWKFLREQITKRHTYKKQKG